MPGAAVTHANPVVLCVVGEPPLGKLGAKYVRSLYLLNQVTKKKQKVL
jgi:hypothetical protein